MEQLGRRCDNLTLELSKTKWTPRYVTEIMLEQIHQGTKAGNDFWKEAWDCMVNLLNYKFGLQLNDVSLRMLFQKLQMQYGSLKALLEHEGFQWDAHPEAQAYWNRTLPNYNDLYLTYGNRHAAGKDRTSDPEILNNATSKNVVDLLEHQAIHVAESSMNLAGSLDATK
ncbi:hypothetical protein ACH5RR_040682 [Cinchona calisaya]|uniref:Myb/SANT-like domain-containing protein n=1 Tax=Cinchona calisaya TaxID=153742 RepID=A0ABD2XWQ3_9GENT